MTGNESGKIDGDAFVNKVVDRAEAKLDLAFDRVLRKRTGWDDKGSVGKRWVAFGGGFVLGLFAATVYFLAIG